MARSPALSTRKSLRENGRKHSRCTRESQAEKSTKASPQLYTMKMLCVSTTWVSSVLQNDALDSSQTVFLIAATGRSWMQFLRLHACFMSNLTCFIRFDPIAKSRCDVIYRMTVGSNWGCLRSSVDNRY